MIAEGAAAMGDVTRVLAAMRSGACLRTQWIARGRCENEAMEWLSGGGDRGLRCP